jgi:hypothetical protein
MAGVFQAPNLGPCCACGCQGDDVRNILMLKRLAPVPGTGWGCVVCGLPPNGAIAILCGACLHSGEPARFAVYGLAADQQRIPVADLPPGEFIHDARAHRQHAHQHPVLHNAIISRTHRTEKGGRR